jgi:hypothetical protein
VTAAFSRSAIIRQKLQHVRGHRFVGRAARFRSRQQGVGAEAVFVLDFAGVASLPDWIVADHERQHLIGLAAAILQERDAIERELSGDRLAAIAALVGEDLFERLCDIPLPDTIDSVSAARLRRPEDFAAIGAELRRSAMPAPLRNADVTDANAAKARLFCDRAASAIAAMEGGR